jgi:hypothetical protein
MARKPSRNDFEDSTINVTFINFTIDRHKWTIVDVGTGETRFDDYLEARDTPGNLDRTTVPLVSDGTVGNAKYAKDDGDFTNASLLTDGQEVMMN